MGIFVACSDEDDFTKSADLRLVFSSDTLSMDTVITGVGTPTHSFVIYNKNKKGIRIYNVMLVKGHNSCFRVNVDGVYINEGFTVPIEVRGKDSVMVFVEATLPDTEDDMPFLKQDELCFLLESGVTQKVVLQAYGQNVEIMNAHIIQSDTLLSGKKPYHIFDSLVVAEGATLEVAEGVRFYFHNKSGLLVNGRIIAHGTLEHPIVFKGDRSDDLVNGQSYDLIPGQWCGISLASNSYGNQFNYCDIHGSEYGIFCDSSSLEREKVRIENSIIHNTTGNGLELRMCKGVVGNSQLSNSGGYCAAVYGGDNQFIHCTLANFYLFDMDRGKALYFTNQMAGKSYPLTRLEFANCILTGYSSDEVLGMQDDDKTIPFQYVFSHCLLDMREEKGDNYQNVWWDTNKNEVARENNFQPFDTDRLIFKFELNAKSLAIGNADTSITRKTYPYDLSGNNRLNDGKSDMGCYEYVFEPSNSENE